MQMSKINWEAHPGGFDPLSIDVSLDSDSDLAQNSFLEPAGNSHSQSQCDFVQTNESDGHFRDLDDSQDLTEFLEDELESRKQEPGG